MSTEKILKLRETPERFVYVPREQVLIDESTGSYLVDRYLENDCLLTRLELRRLREHKYSSLDTSWLDELFMQRFWEYVVNYYPKWLAPNVITLIGLLINLFTVLLLSYFCPTAKEEAPRWTYFLAAVGLFIYQTLDATDGKQARRTRSASPLGELFDHGCDSISQILVALNCCYAFRLGEISGAVFTVSVIAVTLFYCAHWGTYCTGQLRFSKYDVTEAQITVIACLLLTAIFGPDLWTLGVLGIELRQIGFLLAIIGFFYQTYSYMLTVFSGGVGKNGSTVAGTSVLSPFSPLLAVILPFYIIYSGDNTGLYDDYISMFVICLGAVASKATNRLIVAHMSRGEIFVWDWIYLAPIGLMLNQLVSSILIHIFSYYNYPFDQGAVLYMTTIYALLSLYVYCYFITNQLSSYLGIYVFRIPREEVNAKYE